MEVHIYYAGRELTGHVVAEHGAHVEVQIAGSDVTLTFLATEVTR